MDPLFANDPLGHDQIMAIAEPKTRRSIYSTSPSPTGQG
jgi:hypothetical protein